MGWAFFLLVMSSCATGEDSDVGRDLFEASEPSDTWQDIDLTPEADLPPEGGDPAEVPVLDLVEPPADAPDVTDDDPPVDDGLPDIDDSPDIPDTPDTPDVPDIPDTPDLPDAEDTPDAVDIPDTEGCDPSLWHAATAADTPISIPDSDSTGITSWIDVADCGFEVLDIRVTVNIEHSYISDLRVALLSPDGRSAVLHNHSGDGGSDINTTYPTLTAPAETLCKLTRRSSTGRWGLSVIDDSWLDSGRLVSWTLELTGTLGSCSADAWYPSGPFPISIPDSDSTGISSTVDVTASGPITSISVGVDITHTYIGDLIVSIRSPGGTARMLHNRSGDSTYDIHTVYPTPTAPAESLDVYIGTERGGTWTLTVSDNASIDTGTLDGWFLEIR